MKKININTILYKSQKISGWILLLMIIIYFISGYALVQEYGFDKIMSHKDAWKWHSILTIPFLIALIFHVCPSFYFAFKNPKNFWKKLFW